MSDTPRTSELLSELDKLGFREKGWYATERFADFARQLERELAAVTKERDAYRALAEKACAVIDEGNRKIEANNAALAELALLLKR